MKKNKVIVVASNVEYEFAKKYSSLPVIQTGVASSNVIEKLKDLNKNTCLINVGFAGSNKLPIGSIVGVEKSFLHHPNVEFNEKIYNLNVSLQGVKKVNCYSSNDFVLSTQIVEPCVFDMELNTICALGFKVESYKVVSDNLSLTQYEKAESNQIDLEKCFKKVFEELKEQK